jgi:beta-glucuronidase
MILFFVIYGGLMKHLLCMLFIIPSLVIIVQGKQANLITNIEGRTTVSLNGKWQILIDPYENGFYNYRYDEDPNGYFNNAKPKDKSDRVEYDFDTSEQLDVPGDWNSQKEKLFLYEGTVWYKKSFNFAKKKGKRVFVHFGAVNYHAVVYLNGTKLGENEGGFTPFNFEITDLVKEKDNFLIVKVDNKRRRDAVPTLNTDWWNYGGITRDVNLVEVPETYIRDYFIQVKKGSMNEIQGWIQLDGKELNQQIKISIPEAKISKTVQTDENGRAPINFKKALELWSPENPKLYEVIIEIENNNDKIFDLIGFRSIETKGTAILLNRKPIFLRGICIHEEAPIREGRAFSQEDARTLLSWAKELNCNFVRLAHYPHNEHMIREADKMGVMVWSEIPVYWTILWENEATYNNAANQLKQIITRDKNRSSVILWSMANETPVSESRLKFLKNLADLARQLDPTRLITAANERHYKDPQTQVIDDAFGEYLDVLGCNEYIGWYDGLPDKADNMKWESTLNKPVIISEFGAGALYGLHGDALTRWSEEYQESVYQHTLEMLDKVPFIQGMTPWILKDFRSPRRHLPNIQDFWNRKGLISDRGDRKKAFYVLQKYYEKKKEGSI